MDGEGFSETYEIVISIQSVNDAPVLDAISDQEIDEDTSLIYNLEAIDVDGDDFSYTVSIDGNGDASIDGSSLTIAPDTNYNGSIEATVTVTDGEYIDSDTFTLIVNPVNDAPEIADAPTSSTDEDVNIDIVLDGSDIDGDDLVYLLDKD